MSESAAAKTARALVGEGKGLLAMDESNGTCDARLRAAGIPATVEKRAAWRDLLGGAPGLADYVSGAILYDETLRHRDAAGTAFPQALAKAGIMVGVKVDMGVKDLAGAPGEKATEGLDGLRERLSTYAALGARFAKWRSVFSLAPGAPSAAGLEANAHGLARYAALCQEAGLAAIVEPEVLMTGSHGLARCEEATGEILRQVFDSLANQDVALEGVILKPGMILPGEACSAPVSLEAVASATIRCLSRVAPPALAGVAFLSGGQSGPLAAARLNAINRLARSGEARAPWPLVFSFARAIQHPALEIWGGAEANVEPARRALLHRARCSWAAAQGRYDESLEARAL
jgi:fructose-bisphosphate aldolase class I